MHKDQLIMGIAKQIKWLVANIWKIRICALFQTAFDFSIKLINWKNETLKEVSIMPNLKEMSLINKFFIQKSPQNSWIMPLNILNCRESRSLF